MRVFETYAARACGAYRMVRTPCVCMGSGQILGALRLLLGSRCSLGVAQGDRGRVDGAKNICFREVRLSRCTTSRLKHRMESATLWQHSGVEVERSLKISRWQI